MIEIPLMLLRHQGNVGLYREQILAWQSALIEGAKPIDSGGRAQEPTAGLPEQYWYIPDMDACLNLKKRVPARLPDNEFEIARFRLGPIPGPPWLVQINLPSLNERGDTRLAREVDQPHRIWLVRRGKLQKNRVCPAIDFDIFQKIHKKDNILGYRKEEILEPWYKVAMPEGNKKEIREATASFLRLCDTVRRAYSR